MNETARLKPWHSYYEAHAGRAPFYLISDAIAAAPDTVSALDVGAGPLNESRALLNAGFKEVVALDREPEVAAIGARLHDPRLKVETVSFSRYAFPPDRFSLVAACKALPFSGDGFEPLVAHIKKSLKPGGVFVGNVFGMRHAFRNNVSLHFCTEDEIRNLLSDMEILVFNESERDEDTSDGQIHWHSFNFVARKK